jgi:hypothetical protein
LGGRWRRADRSRRCGYACYGQPERARERTRSLVPDCRPPASLRSSAGRSWPFHERGTASFFLGVGSTAVRPPPALDDRARRSQRGASRDGGRARGGVRRGRREARAVPARLPRTVRDRENHGAGAASGVPASPGRRLMAWGKGAERLAVKIEDEFAPLGGARSPASHAARRPPAARRGTANAVPRRCDTTEDAIDCRSRLRASGLRLGACNPTTLIRLGRLAEACCS